MNPTEQATQAAGPEVRAAVTTPEKTETRIGTLEFRDGMPSRDTLDKVYDHLDFARAFDAFVNAYQGVNTHGLHRGFLQAGVGDNEVLIYPELIDSRSLFLTANADTVYGGGFLDLGDGPMVIETPPGFLGAVNDYWGGWVTDVGAPGGDRGLGGRYLIVPEGYDGPLPEGGFFIAFSKTTHLLLFGRLFLQDDDPKPAAKLLRTLLQGLPVPGRRGRHALRRVPPWRGAARSRHAAARDGDPRERPVVDTIMPGDFSYFEWLDEVVQQEPTGSLDPELMGPIAAIGIVKGKPFAPDERMKRILTEAAAVGNATARSLFMRPRDPELVLLPRLGLDAAHADDQRLRLRDPAARYRGAGPRRPAHAHGRPHLPADRLPDARRPHLLLLRRHGDQPGRDDAPERHRLPVPDGRPWTRTRQYFDGVRTYKVTLPGTIPARNFWSLTLYDTQSRAMLRTPQRWPRAGSQRYPSPAAEVEADGSTTVYFGPEQPEGVPRGNWIQTLPGKGWFVLLRLYGPLEPFFDKSWRAGEVEPVA